MGYWQRMRAEGGQRETGRAIEKVPRHQRRPSGLLIYMNLYQEHCEAKMTKLPKAPNYFSGKARKLWASIHAEYELEPEAGELLRLGLENMDLGDKARELLRAEGLVVDGKKHPASDAVKLHDGLFLRAIRQLALDIVGPGPVGRPPGRKT